MGTRLSIFADTATTTAAGHEHRHLVEEHTTTAADHQPPPCSRLPAHLLELIADKTRDAVAGLTLFRSVCPAWRAAVAAPRLLIPAPFNGAAPPPAGRSDHVVVFPLARGWSLVVDAHDTSCRLSHLLTGTTAALPSLTAVRATATSSRVTHLSYEHFDAPAAASPAPARVPRRRRSFPAKRRFRLALAAVVADAGDVAGERRRRRMRSGWKLRMDPRWMSILVKPQKPSPLPNTKIHLIRDGDSSFFLENNLQFAGAARFAVHMPPGAPAASADGMLILMFHLLQGQAGLLFCRPGDAAWTKVENPVVADGDPVRHGTSVFPFADFAYLDGKIFALDKDGATVVLDAGTLEVLDLVGMPPGTINFATKYGYGADGQDPGDDRRSNLHLVALPSKLLLVRIVTRFSEEPEAIDVFELRPDGGGGGSWSKVVGPDGIGGDYDLFLDGHHATFHGGGGGSRGNRIYYVHEKCIGDASAAAYCYSLQDDKLECVYRTPPEESDWEYSSIPSWFVP
ncbi:hypothetical protein ACP4OV_031115 [Aristida adscensionis]